MYGLNLHISLDDIVLNTALRAALRKHFRAVYPKVINAYSATRIDMGLALLEEWHDEFPNTRIVWRLMEDNGRDGSLPAHEIYALFLPYFQRYPWLTILAGNETSYRADQQDEFEAYVTNTADLLEMAGDAGYRIAFFRAPTGNYPESLYPLMAPAFEVNARYGNLHTYSPNEYTDKAVAGGSGSIARYKQAWKVCTDNGIAIPDTHIGEFGLTLDYNPQKSWRNQFSGVAHEDQYISEVLAPPYRQWYQPDGVPVCVFMFPPGVPPWDELGVGEAALTAIEQSMKEKPDPAIPLPPPRPTPPPLPDANPGVEDPRWTPATAQKRGQLSVQVRIAPVVGREVVGKLALPAPYRVHVIPRDDMTEREKQRSLEGDKFWWLIKLPDNQVGWVRNDVVTIIILVEPPPDLEYATKDDVDQLRRDMLAYFDAKFETLPEAVLLKLFEHWLGDNWYITRKEKKAG